MEMAVTVKGSTCLHGHEGLRYAKTGQCVTCNKVRLQKWRKANPVKAAQYNQRDRLNSNRRVAKWKRLNKDKINAVNQKRRATKLNACPSWLTHEDLCLIESFYFIARKLTEQTGIEYHVDHIHPLNGKTAKGLHVPWNLQVIPASVNLKKGNKL
jgi:hypothetical protein